MNVQQVLAILNDLPTTFRRDAPPYTQFIDATAGAIARGTSATDAISNQVSQISNAQFGWLDIWGLLFGIQRMTNEPDSHYLNRIQYEVSAGNGTPCAIANWIFAVWGINVTVSESFPSPGYTLQFPNTLTVSQITQIVNSIARVRPAGVPFIVQISSAGPFLTTINFLNAPRTTGAFLAGGNSTQELTLVAATNNSQPLLPDIFLTDPALQSQSLPS